MSHFPAAAEAWTVAHHGDAARLAPLAHACRALRVLPTPGGGAVRHCAAGRFAPGGIDATLMPCLECLVLRPSDADRRPLPGWTAPADPDDLFARIRACPNWSPGDCSCGLDRCAAGKGTEAGKVTLADCRACLGC